MDFTRDLIINGVEDTIMKNLIVNYEKLNETCE